MFFCYCQRWSVWPCQIAILLEVYRRIIGNRVEGRPATVFFLACQVREVINPIAPIQIYESGLDLDLVITQV